MGSTGHALAPSYSSGEILNSSEIFILGSAIIGIIFGLYNAWWILRIEIVNKEEEVMQLKDDRQMKKLKEM